MALRADLSDLPRPATLRSDGWAPDPEPRFVHLLAEQWAAEDLEAGSKARAFPDARFRHSDAGACARSVALAALDVPASNPMDLTGTWNTRLGTLIHDAWQAAISARYPDALIEPKMRSVDGRGAGHADAFFPPTSVTTEAGRKILFELKSVGGFAFKMAVGERGTAQGPKSEHICQTALNGKGMDADEIVIGYLSKEAISVAVAARKNFSELGRFCAEWSMGADEFLPIAAAEEARIAGILELLDADTLPARKIPSSDIPTGAVIVDPSTGRWEVHAVPTDVEPGVVAEPKLVDTGTAWNCGYCRYQDLCVQMPAGRCPTSEIPIDLSAVAS